MNPQFDRNPVLNPLERFSEIVFGLIMVLTFTCALGVAEATRDDVRTMFFGAIGCNLAWGIIDAVFYIIACVTEHGRNATLLRSAQECTDRDKAQQMIADVLPSKVADALQPEHFDHIHAHLKQLPPPTAKLRLSAGNVRGAIGVFALVFLSTLPVVLPFAFIHAPHVALRVSNAVAIVLLFGAGHMLARHAGLRPIRMGLAMIAIGVALVSIAIALGG
jgi:VIT1/CCC1 family predicted Fe2+/Mn2+ transporter